MPWSASSCGIFDPRRDTLENLAQKPLGHRNSRASLLPRPLMDTSSRVDVERRGNARRAECAVELLGGGERDCVALASGQEQRRREVGGTLNRAEGAGREADESLQLHHARR